MQCGDKDFIWFFEIEEHGASEAHKKEFLNYEGLKILKVNNIFLWKFDWFCAVILWEFEFFN